MQNRKLVAIGLLGSVLDAGFHEERWKKWRPTVSLFQHADLPIGRCELIHFKAHADIARCVSADIKRVSPQTETRLTIQDLAKWYANFRDLNACVTRMATLAPGGRVTQTVLDSEMDRLRKGWAPPTGDSGHETVLQGILSRQAMEKLDLFDQAQLAFVIGVCRQSASMSEAGRKLFAATREQRKTTNDADRLRKFLARFELDWATVRPTP